MISKENVGVAVNQVKTTSGCLVIAERSFRETVIHRLRKSQPQPVIQQEAFASTMQISFSLGKNFRQGCVHNFINPFFTTLPFAARNSLVFKENSHEIVGNVGFGAHTVQLIISMFAVS